MRMCIRVIQSVCVSLCMILICASFFSDPEMPWLLKSVLFNKTAIMLRVAIRRKCADCWHVGEVSES